MATINKNLSEYDENSIPDAKNFRFGIVVSEWNDTITEGLFNGAVTGLLENESIVRGHKGADGNFQPEQVEYFALLKDNTRFGEKGWLKLQTLRVIQFRTEPRESPQNKFSPLEMPQIKLRAFTFYSNDVLYGFQPDATNIYVGGGVNFGAARRIASMEEVARRMKPRNYYKWVFLILVVAAIISSIFRVLLPMGHKQNSS